MLEQSLDTVTFPAQLASLAGINDFVTLAARRAGLDDRAVYAVQVAVEEACSNIIKHAYDETTRDCIECSCLIQTEGLQISLHDHGRPFDPSSITPPNLTAELADRKIGGLGLYFINKLMDEVQIMAQPEGGNVMILVKRKSPHGIPNATNTGIPQSAK